VIVGDETLAARGRVRLEQDDHDHAWALAEVGQGAFP
jgi:hypothetical protein